MKPITKDTLNERAAELVEEFRRHASTFKAQHPELAPFDGHTIFEGWVLQKLANLQILVENLYRRHPLPLNPGAETAELSLLDETGE